MVWHGLKHATWAERNKAGRKTSGSDVDTPRTVQNTLLPLKPTVVHWKCVQSLCVICLGEESFYSPTRKTKQLYTQTIAINSSSFNAQSLIANQPYLEAFRAHKSQKDAVNVPLKTKPKHSIFQFLRSHTWMVRNDLSAVLRTAARTAAGCRADAPCGRRGWAEQYVV